MAVVHIWSAGKQIFLSQNWFQYEIINFMKRLKNFFCLSWKWSFYAYAILTDQWQYIKPVQKIIRTGVFFKPQLFWHVQKQCPSMTTLWSISLCIVILISITSEMASILCLIHITLIQYSSPVFTSSDFMKRFQLSSIFHNKHINKSPCHLLSFGMFH